MTAQSIIALVALAFWLAVLQALRWLSGANWEQLFSIGR